MTKNLSMYKLKRLLNSCVIIISCIALGALAAIVAVGLRIQTAKVSKFLGNQTENAIFTNATHFLKFRIRSCNASAFRNIGFVISLFEQVL